MSIKALYNFLNDAESKCSVLETSDIHQSIEKFSKFCTHLAETRHVCSAIQHGRCRDNNPTRLKLCSVSLVMKAMTVVFDFLYHAYVATQLGGFMRNCVRNEHCTAVQTLTSLTA